MATPIGVPFPDPGQKPPVVPFRPTFPPEAPPEAPAPGPTPEPTPAPTPTPAPPVEPTEPRQPEAIPEPFSLGGWLLVLGLIAIAAALADLLNFLSRALWRLIFPRRNAPQVTTEQLLQPLSNKLGTWEQGIDAYMGMSFTKLASLVGQLAAAIPGSEQSALNVAKALQRARGEQASTAKQTSGLAKRLDGQTATQTRTAERVKQVAAQSHAHENALQGQIDGLTHHVKHVLEPELDALRGRIPHLEKGATVAWDEIKKHDELLGIGAFTAATAVALGRLGGGWLRCEATRELGRAACRNNSTIGKLLAGTIDVLAISDICALSEAVLVTAETLRPGLEAFVSAENALIGCHGADQAARIKLPRVSPTPVFATVSL